MATVTRTYLVDDIDRSDTDVETVRFALDGRDYEIDLGPANAARLRDKLVRFVEHAKPVRTRSGPPRRPGRVIRPAASGADQVRAIRDWAAARYQVSARGRIPQAVREAFDAAH